MKTISKDKTFVDYTGPRYGVRVWNDSCQPIGLESSAWTGYDTKYSLPVAQHIIELPVNCADWVSPFATNVLKYEQCKPDELTEDKTELRRLLIGAAQLPDVI